MLSDSAYTELAKRKGKRSFSELIIELIGVEQSKKKDPKKLLEMSGIIKTKNKVSWSTEVDDILYGGPL